MTRRMFGGGFLAGAIIACSAVAFAQAGVYNRSAETTIKGVVTTIIGAEGHGAIGVHLDVKTDSGVLDVHVAPAGFIGANNFWFESGDKVEITGVKLSSVDFWARVIKRGDKVLELRDADGNPKWTAESGADGCGVSHAPIR